MPTKTALKQPEAATSRTPVRLTTALARPERTARSKRQTPADDVSETLAFTEQTRGFRVLKDEIIRADKRGRLTVGDTAAEKLFRILINGDGQILLDPVVVMSEREVWLYKNPEALASVLQGLRDAAAGEVHDLGSFAHAASDDADDA